MSLTIDIRDALQLDDFLADMPEIVNKAASIAMNDVVGGSGLARFRRAINEQVNFPDGYVDGDRFYQDMKATPTRLQTSLLARQRPTSLARFAVSGTVGSKGGVAVRVKKNGASKTIKGAFLVRLRAGSSLENGNVGLALRLKPGEVIANKKDTARMVHLEANVVLLYGPSIDQVLRNDVADAETPAVVDSIATEFFRQFARLNNA